MPEVTALMAVRRLLKCLEFLFSLSKAYFWRIKSSQTYYQKERHGMAWFGGIFLFVIIVIQGCDFTTGRPDEFVKYDSAQYERVSINYEVVGDSDTTLVFIHDWNLNLRYWDTTITHFRNQYRILNLDLAGHGESARARKQWTIESFARDIVTILEKEQVSKAVLIGHALGGEVALQVFQLAPERIAGIVGIELFRDVGFEMTEEFEEDFVDHLNRFKRDYTDMSDEVARERIRSKDKDLINRIVKDYKKADPKISLAIYTSMVGKYAQEKTHIQKLPFKLNIIASDYKDVDEETLNRYARSGYQVFWIKDAGHFPMVEHPEAFNDVLAGILSGMSDN